MSNSLWEPFIISVHTKNGRYTLWISRAGRQLEIEVEEPSARKSQYLWRAGKPISKEYEPGKSKYHKVPSLFSLAEVPTYKIVTEEIGEVIEKAVKEFQRFELERQEARS